jgi:hypothetical protein
MSSGRGAFGPGEAIELRAPGRGADRTLENDQSRWASREAGCPLLRDVRRVMRLVISVIAAQVISDSDSLN